MKDAELNSEDEIDPVSPTQELLRMCVYYYEIVGGTKENHFSCILYLKLLMQPYNSS